MGTVDEFAPAALIEKLERAQRTLWRQARALPPERWSEAPPAPFSPLGWHLGHVVAVLVRHLELPGILDDAQLRFFDPQATAKAARTRLPPPEVLGEWLERAHQGARRWLEQGRTSPFEHQALALGLPRLYLAQFLCEHELQHAEHVAVIAALLEDRLHRARTQAVEPMRGARASWIPGGTYRLGCHGHLGPLDNERELHEVALPDFLLDRRLVTVGEFSLFVADGGYRDLRHWSSGGWRLVTERNLEAPRGWVQVAGHGWAHPDGEAALDHPVCGVSWYEAEAFARWANARLPTEAEWEVAASEGGRHRFVGGELPPTPGVANLDGRFGGTTPVGALPEGPFGLCDLAGNLWEWTSTTFEPYPGFQAYPYRGYSEPWFGGTHYVVRGGSWATAPALMRVSFRNWYEPIWRELPIGFRLAGRAG